MASFIASLVMEIPARPWRWQIHSIDRLRSYFQLTALRSYFQLTALRSYFQLTPGGAPASAGKLCDSNPEPAQSIWKQGRRTQPFAERPPWRNLRLSRSEWSGEKHLHQNVPRAREAERRPGARSRRAHRRRQRSPEDWIPPRGFPVLHVAERIGAPQAPWTPLRHDQGPSPRARPCPS